MARRAPSRTGCRSPSTAARPSIGWSSIRCRTTTPIRSSPPTRMTFAIYGITDFTVQGWNGSAGSTLATVSGNNLVKRTRQLRRLHHRSHPDQHHRRPQLRGPASPKSRPGASMRRTGRRRTTTLTSSLNPARCGRERHLHRDGDRHAIPTGNVGFTERRQRDQRLQRGRAHRQRQQQHRHLQHQQPRRRHAQHRRQLRRRCRQRRSTSAPLSQVITAAAAAAATWRWPVPAAVASASSTYGAGYPVSAVNNNERAGASWGNGGGWADGTPSTFPDWVQIVFNGSKTIDRVVVYTVQDNYLSRSSPPTRMTFATYGITDFTVQGWNGSSWIDPGHGQRQQPGQAHASPSRPTPPIASASTSPPPAAPAPTSPRSKPGPRRAQASDCRRMEHFRARRAAHRAVHDGIAAAQPDPLADARGSAAAIQRQRLPSDSLRLAADHVREHGDRSRSRPAPRADSGWKRAAGSDGALEWSMTTDYILPPASWIPAFGPALTSQSRLYFPGAGGTVYFRDQADATVGDERPDRVLRARRTTRRIRRRTTRASSSIRRSPPTPRETSISASWSPAAHLSD